MECWGLKKPLLMLMMIHILMVIRQTQGNCIEEERNALLEIKASHIKSFHSKNDHFLPTWVGYGGGDCCGWERVSCNTTTAHVTDLSLDSLIDLDTYIGDESKLWALNVSLFLHFKELKSLSLSANFLDKEIMIKTGVERLSSLQKLEVLDLSGNYDIDNDILPSLRTLTSLKVLDLSDNGLNGNFPTNEFAALENLEMLDLSGCSFNGTFEIEGSERVSILRKLKTLNLAGNRFNESVITSLSTLSSLTKLDLSYNAFLSGRFPAEELSHLRNLEELDLSSNWLSDTPSIQGSERGSMLRKLKTLNLRNNRFNESVITSLSTLSSLTKLDLSYNAFLSGRFPAEELSHLRNLEELDLGGNQLNDTPSIQACQSLSRLRRLESIYLSYNRFNKSIISCLTALPSLKTLHLEYAFPQGSSFPVQEFHNLLDLEVLDLSSNFFKGTLPMEAFTSSHHLRVLDMSGNNFVGSIPLAIQTLSSLQALSLAYNNLNGSLSDHGLCELKKLRELDLSGNMIDGTVPQCFENLSSLKFLDISSNRFTAVLAPSTSLEYIDFSDNNFEGSFSFSSFSNHTKLEFVAFGCDNENFEVETEEPIGWIPMFQLKVLVLSKCNINRPTRRVVPGFLLHQHKLLELDMSHNSLEGQFPNWLLENNTNLEAFKLRNNSLNGSMAPLYWNANMKHLDMSGNQMRGSIPEDISKFFPNLQFLNLSMNVLSGAIPSSLGDFCRLWILDLSDNELSGEVPLGLFTNKSNLDLLKLSKNKLYGEVLSGISSFLNIGRVHLDSNNFTGKIGIKSSENEFVSLSLLDISNNFFTGTIPDWIGNMSSLSELVVRNNSFQGRFPCGAAPFLFLDISQNSFSGPIPFCLNLQNMEHLHLGSNRFTGSVPNFFRNLTNVLTFDIGNNNLSGKIPEFVGELSNLRILILGKNNFGGSIPKQLCQLSKASLIDLSDNSLSGSIPSCLQNIIGPTDLVFLQKRKAGYGGGSIDSSYMYVSVLFMPHFIDSLTYLFETQDEVRFTTKSVSRPYKGDILDYMAGLDLSCNKLTGEIPEGLGLLTRILVLNLSHNQLTGPIPVNFSNLKNLESLDLSSNGLTGKVPSELIQLTYLEFLNVSHNNLSGRLPDMKAQFGTFTNASYEGNPLLCGLPLEKKCMIEPHVTDPSPEKEEVTEKWYDVDMMCFYGSSSSTCVVFLLGFVATLYINPQWRRRWLDLVEEYMYKCYYFLYDSIRKPCMIFRK